MMPGWFRISIIALLGAVLFLTVWFLPAFGSLENRAIAVYYLNNSLTDTGSANAVNAIVWDYRGYDTLGEETVLFAAALGVFIIIVSKRSHYGYHSKNHE
jgi:multicomponent Na+:H+ antiporter subunit B